jgi:hypothetical protein
MTEIRHPGIYLPADIPMADYLADPCVEPSLSSGAAHRLLTQSPAHVYASHPRLGGRVDDSSSASDTGSAAHDLLLGGEGMVRVIDPADYRSKPTKDYPEGRIPDGWTNNAIRAARDEARQQGYAPILAADWSGIAAMRDAARDFLAVSEINGVLSSGQQEMTMLAQIDGAWFRARPDWLNHDQKIMLHYKTTKASAEPRRFERTVLGAMGYDVALAFYRLVFEHLTGATDWAHVILAQEQDAPYACSLIGLDRAKWALSDQKVGEAVAIWKRCLKSHRWPAYATSIHYATPTPWELAESETKLQESAQ